ncbi:MBL fold metallo-hydrolase, partial [Patescibacteria group bacterium]|nr:MBL fold metallo-hydrolase [Patescibacteria group bacterium]
RSNPLRQIKNCCRILTMQISYFGNTGFLLKGNDASVALALPAEKIGNAEIVVTATENEEMKASAEQTVFDWSGEYEARGVSVQLIPVGNEKPSRIAKIIIDGISIVHLDGVTEPLTETEEEQIGGVDMLLVSVGKAAALGEKQIKNTIEALEPKIVVPMNFAAGEEIEFAKTLGFGEVEGEDSLKLKAESLPSERMELKILRPRK